ncbi:Peptide transporter [Lachnellula willkommii]|uniref:Peptide transporter n=1 Tax=Lachnellula willkommii TaxID=215461 RepID=A0A559M340_9HELO|nr:Peptide transporter [Lachnellula willkommii]
MLTKFFCAPCQVHPFVVSITMSVQVLEEAQVVVGSEAPPAFAEKGPMFHADPYNQHGAEVAGDGEAAATEEELSTLRRVAGSIPMTAYLLCIVEFAERGSFYGVKQVFSNFVNRPLPAGGNGGGAPPRGTQQTAGALGKGTVVAAAVVSSFSFLVYALPMFGGWLADAKWGRFRTICVGVAICGLGHVIMVIAALPSVLQAGNAYAPFMISVYILAIGSALFKPCISVVLLDQNPHKKPVTKTLGTGEKVVIDPGATTERIMLWFYLLINIGAFLGVATAYLAKLVAFWPAFLLPGIIYFLLPPLLWFLYPRLILHKPGGSDLGNVCKILVICLRRGGLKSIGRKGFFNHAKPSVIAQSNDPISVPWSDLFISDILVNVTAYAIAYSHAPKNMRGLISAVNCFMSAIQYAINLATAPAISDPHIVWAFAGPSIVGFVLAWVFLYIYKDLDHEEYVLNDDLYDNTVVSTPHSNRTSDVEGVSKAADFGADEKNARQRV